MRLPARRRIAGGRARRPARRARSFNGARILGGGMVVVAVLSWAWLTDPTRFAVDERRIDIEGIGYTDVTLVRERIGLPLGSTANVFRLRTADMERRLLELPAVAEAEVRAVLPDALVVSVTERVPVLIWRTTDTDFLVDADGVLIDEADRADLPMVEDRRPPADALEVGDSLEPIDREVSLRLAALTPELVGSEAERLGVVIVPDEGYVVEPEPPAWRAVFGHYTPTLRPPEVIDRQVQCLRSLLGQGEAAIETIHLAVADDRCGTFLPRETPLSDESPTPEP